MLDPWVRKAAGAWVRLRRPLSPPVAVPKGVWSTASEWIAHRPDRLPPGARAIEIHPAQPKRRRLPQPSGGQVHWKFLAHQERDWARAGIATIPVGRVWGAGEAAITPDNYLLADLARVVGETEDYLTDPTQHPLFARKSLPAPRRLGGTAAMLASPGGGGYYHWMVDVLPRLDLLRRAGIRLSEIDHFLVNSMSASYQRETAQLFGIDRSKVIETRWNPHVEAERLVFPSLPGEFGHVPRWACDFLRQTFLGDRTDADQLLYLNRTHVTHRQIENEPELIERLEARGFTDVSLDSLSVRQQAHRLSRARVVVAPHGAALTNIVFCQPGTLVIELLSPRDVSHVYWTLAETMNLEYAYVIGEGPRPPVGVDPHDGEADIAVSPDAVETVLDRAARSLELKSASAMSAQPYQEHSASFA